MNDKLFYPLVIISIVFMVALALVWPQGEGARSPAPFGHAVIQPDRIRAQKEKAERKVKQKADEVHKAAQKAQPELRATH
jgi:hypothetical protein